jgi:D-3-phosphoglycerate dehydrogenase / 2-oxoglutarate reductase
MKILIASPIDPETLKELENHYTVICAFDAAPEILTTAIQGCEALIFRSGVKITREVMQGSPDLQLIIRAGSGIDNIDIEYVYQRKLEFVRIPEPGARAVAEMSFALMLALSRDIFLADRMTRQGHWIKHEINGYLLEKKILGIVGLGNIGSKVGQMGLDWGMHVIGCVEHPSPERAQEFLARGIILTSFEEVISRSDYISIHVPLKDSTRNLINTKTFNQMKPGVYLINLARGGVVDEEALLNAMSNGGSVRGAALDVHKQEGEGRVSPLASLPNVILTPHVGAMTIDTQREIGCRIMETIQLFVARCAQIKVRI